MNTQLENEPLKLYSQKAIGIATFLGGPLAAGILVRRNFINLDKPEYGTHALFIGILSTALLFTGIFSIPEEIIEKIPSSLIPGIYTLIISLIVHKLMGKDLEKHAESQGQFYSGWRAAGVGVIGLIVISAGLFAYIYSLSDDFDYEKYDSKIDVFNQNEAEALKIYDLMETGEFDKIPSFVQQTGIPLWQQNIQIIDTLDAMDGLYDELIYQNRMLRRYCELRIEACQLIGNTKAQSLDDYYYKVDGIHEEIQATLDSLQANM